MELINFKPESNKTDISEALRYLTNALKKKSTTFLISDFMDTEGESTKPKFEEALKIANNKHDIIALKVYDERETEIPSIGMLKLKDAESGEEMWVDTSSKKICEGYKKWWHDTDLNLKELFNKTGVDNVAIRTDQDYVKPLMTLFKKR